MNIKNAFLIGTSLAVATLGACTRHQGESVSRDMLYNNATTVDSEGFTFFKEVHAKAVFETQLAEHVQAASPSAQAREVAAQVIRTYEEVIPELEAMGAESQVILPDPGMAAFAVPEQFVADSTGTINSEAYITHVKHEQGIILEQFKRASRNTSKMLKTYAAEKVPAVEALYTTVGGEPDHDAHH